jgi:hypothetical protein
MATAHVQVPCTDDDRQHTRVPHEMDLAYITAGGQGGLAQCVNISRAGFALNLGRALRPGTILSLMFEDDACVEPFEVQAEIAWCQTESDTESFSAGARIRAMSVHARDRLIELLEEHTNQSEPAHAHAA